MRIINIALLAHVDAGKTTTVEQLLYHTGALKIPGSIEEGNTRTDWLDIERQRGISVQASATVLYLPDTRINLIDTPGHMDFTGETERALYAVDCAVLLVSAVEGMQSQTEVFWQSLRALNLPTLIFVNKIDRTGCDPAAVLAELRTVCSPYILPLNAPVDFGNRACAVYPVPLSTNEDALLSLCEADASLGERFLSGEALPEEALSAALATHTASGTVFPLVYGSAAQGIGIRDLLIAMRAYLPACDTRAELPLSGTVYKIEHDKAMGKIAHIRLFQGKLQTRDVVHLLREGEKEPIEGKVTQIRRVNGPRREDTGTLTAGDIAAVYGLSGARCRDIVGERLERTFPSMATPLFAVRILCDCPDPAPLRKAVAELSDEDPLLHYEWESETRELHIRIMGAIQLEVLAFLLRERYNLAVDFSPPTVIYKETPLQSGVGFEAYTMPKPCWAVIKLQLDPLPRGAKVTFASVVPPRDILPRYQHHIEECLPRAMRQGLHGWEVTDCKVTLIGGEHHLMHTHPMDFFLATPMAFMDALRRCGSGLLEPMLRTRITAEEGLANRLIGEILSMRGEFDSPVMRNGWMHVEALLPVATSLDFPVRLASLTSGRGQLKTAFAGYRDCPLELGATAVRRGVNPLDRAKWILHNRNAL